MTSNKHRTGNYVIIGASSGIGAALADQLIANGDRVLGTYNQTTPDNSTQVDFQQFNALRDELDTSDFPDEIHGLAYCPGSINLKPFKRFNEEDFIDDFRLQVSSGIKVIQQLLPSLKRANGSIVLFSTIAVQQGFQFHSQVSASKGAIEGLTRSLAAELAPSIRVNAVAPSLTNTPLAERLLSNQQKLELQAEKNPLKKVGDAQDIASAAKFLLTPESSWITGQIIHVDGGYSRIK